MRVVFFTNDGVEKSEAFLYMFAQVAAFFPDIHVVAVRRQPDGLFRRYLKMLRRVWRFGGGLTNALEIVSSLPLKVLIADPNEREEEAEIRALPRPPVTPRPDATVFVETVNGPDAVEAISRLEPDVVIQSGAGVLKEQVFKIGRIGTLNLHPGIAPLIKGRDPIYWALWELEPKWLGATVHFIDGGIDTGPVLAYAPIEQRFPGERYPELSVRVHEAGVECLVETLLRLARGERWTIEPPPGARVYRSSISGWKLLLLEIRDMLRRRSAGKR